MTNLRDAFELFLMPPHKRVLDDEPMFHLDEQGFYRNDKTHEMWEDFQNALKGWKFVEVV